MTLKRVALALNELSEALFEHIEQGGTAEVSPPPTSAASTFAQTQAPSPANVGECPVHHVAWRTTKRDGSPAKRAFCSQKNGDEFCDQKGPWL